MKLKIIHSVQNHFPKSFEIGKDSDGNAIFLDPPSWDDGWHWSFGHLGNSKCGFYLSGLIDKYNTNLYDALKFEFGDSLKIKDEYLSDFCELCISIYTLKETARLFYKGHNAHSIKYKDTLKNKELCKDINENILPKLFLLLTDIVSIHQ